MKTTTFLFTLAIGAALMIVSSGPLPTNMLTTIAITSPMTPIIR